MLKKLFAAAALCAAFAGSAQIQNNGFESWTDTTTPDFWDTSNGDSPTPGVLQGEPGHMSPFSALMQPSFDGNLFPAILHQTITVDQAYENLEFYWSGNIPATDTLFAIATAVSESGDVLGITLGIYTATSTVGFQQEVAPFFYFTDPVGIAFVDLSLFYITYSDQPNAGIYVDDVNLTGVVANVGAVESVPAFFAQDGELIRFSMKEQGTQTASIYSLTGQLMDRWNVTNAQGTNERDIARLASGVYVFQCGTSRMKFVKQ